MRVLRPKLSLPIFGQWCLIPLLSIASFNLAAWVLGAILTLFGFVTSAKSGVERMTLRHLARKRERHALRYAMMAQSRA